MNILILGGGAREHAIGWKLADSARTPNLFFAPGNGGTFTLGKNLSFDINSPDEVVRQAQSHDVSLVIVGPEAPLVAGVADALRKAGIPVVGPNAKAAQLEGSKAYAKGFMMRCGIPTAEYQVWRRQDKDAAYEWASQLTEPVVLKADGLAAGKGVFLCYDAQQTEMTLRQFWEGGRLGTASDTVIAEELLVGPELSIIVATDGDSYRILPPSRDYKRAQDGDKGPNTGGMGAISPTPDYDSLEISMIESQFVQPTIKGLKAEGLAFRGFLFLGLLRGKQGIRLLEYNVRLGDPETQVVLPRIENDFVDFCMAIANGKLADARLKIRIDPVVAITVSAEGYPDDYPKGMKIAGLAEAEAVEYVHIFHAGTTRNGDELVTSGGRVLTVCAAGGRIEKARERAYRAVSKLCFDHIYFRKDIAEGM